MKKYECSRKRKNKANRNLLFSHNLNHNNMKAVRQLRAHDPKLYAKKKGGGWEEGKCSPACASAQDRLCPFRESARRVPFTTTTTTAMPHRKPVFRIQTLQSFFPPPPFSFPKGSYNLPSTCVRSFGL